MYGRHHSHHLRHGAYHVMTHGNARGSVKSGDDPIWRVDVGVVDVVLAPVTCVDRVKTWSNT